VDQRQGKWWNAATLGEYRSRSPTSFLETAMDNGSVTITASASSIRYIEERIGPLRARLAAHPLYASITSPKHIRTFMESHVFAVWDFMSLLTTLQRMLTCVSTPWVPTPWPASRRFINEIVLGEESDKFEGRSISHFELYLEAMEECGADTGQIRNLLAQIEIGPPNTPISKVMELAAVPAAARRFVQTTFAIIESSNVSAMAAAFTFGREDLIPDMFRKLVRDMDRSGAGRLSKFVWYLERHIEVDGDEHGPLSLQMVSDLCGANEDVWAAAATTAETAISARLALWDEILDSLSAQQ
jgi:hypothetical protein